MSVVLDKPAQAQPSAPLLRDGRISIYQPEQKGLIYPELPDFTSVAAHRQHLKERLVAACRAFALEGFDYGFAGHLTIRDPEHPELYWTNPMAVHFAQVKVSNLIWPTTRGAWSSRHAINRAGFVLHAAVHEAHPDIVAMCHAHTVYGTAFARWASRWPRFHRMQQPSSRTMSSSRKRRGRWLWKSVRHLGVRLVQRCEGCDPPEPWSAHSQSAQHRGGRLLVHRAGALLPPTVAGGGHRAKAVMVPADKSRYSREHVGSEYIGWLHFQPIWEHLVATQPDMFA
jgi:hypothetical protein